MALMEPEFLELLCSPGDLRPLRAEGDTLLAEDGRRFPVRQGIPCFLDNFSSPWQHRFWRTFYDRFAFAYDATLHLGERLRIGSEERIRRDFIAAQEVPKKGMVLEVGCGTSANRTYLPQDVTYVGVDISFKMLRRAKSRCAAQDLSAHFVQADAIALPIRGSQADLVIAMGVLQHIPGSQQTLNEMSRVAKTGAHLLLIDELKPKPLLRKLPWTTILKSGQRKNIDGLRVHFDVVSSLKPVRLQFLREYFILNLEKIG